MLSFQRHITYGHEKIEGSFYEKEIQRVVKLTTLSKLKQFCLRENAKASRNILSSGRAIRKNSIRGLANPT